MRLPCYCPSNRTACSSATGAGLWPAPATELPATAANCPALLKNKNPSVRSNFAPRFAIASRSSHTRISSRCRSASARGSACPKSRCRRTGSGSAGPAACATPFLLLKMHISNRSQIAFLKTPRKAASTTAGSASSAT